MKRTINSTGRKSLPLESLAIRIASFGGRTTFTAAIDIPRHWALPAASRVYVEAYVKSSSQRFDFGTVGDPRRPPSTELTDVDTGGAVLFRVKIVDTSLAVGRILASANGIRPQSDADGDDRRPLLPVQERNLGELLWLLELPDESGPVLVVNNRIADISSRLKTDPLMRAAVLPEVMRQAVLHAYAVGNQGDEWADDWKAFACEILGREIPEEQFSEAPSLDDDGRATLSEIVNRFSNQQNFASAILSVAEVVSDA